ncbi:cation channel sperm-associated protein subunit beta-like, partial [Mus caroli]|uniref:Cation channel sperm-associated protein subunit beta-like n=1 Tax=Mus caroli TaxID=10089 RepID=A0A6P5P3U3_MUSCR
IWISMDGGNTFEMLCDLFRNYIKMSSHSFYTSDIVFIGNDGRIFMTKAGLKRYGELGKFKDKVFTLYYDQLGYIHKLTPRNFDAGSKLLGYGSSHSIFGKAPDLGFETALVPQYISAKELLFFAYVPLNTHKAYQFEKWFKHIHLGKVLEF